MGINCIKEIVTTCDDGHVLHYDTKNCHCTTRMSKLGKSNKVRKTDIKIGVARLDHIHKWAIATINAHQTEKSPLVLNPCNTTWSIIIHGERIEVSVCW